MGFEKLQMPFSIQIMVILKHNLRKDSTQNPEILSNQQDRWIQQTSIYNKHSLN